MSSEHSIDGGYFGAELHMVHGRVGDNGAHKDYAVVGTMITPTATSNNPMFEAWLQRWIKFMNDEACNFRDVETGTIELSPNFTVPCSWKL